MRKRLCLLFLLTACGPTRYPIGDRWVEVSSDEVDEIARLTEGVKRAPLNYHAHCMYWRRATPATSAGRAFVKEQATETCKLDPAREFAGTVAAREAQIAKTLKGYTADGAAFPVQVGVRLKVPMERGRCYSVVIRYPEGFAEDAKVQVTESFVFANGPGPVSILQPNCPTAKSERSFVLTAPAGTKAEGQIFTKTITEAELDKKDEDFEKAKRQAESDFRRSQAAEKRALAQSCAYCIRETGCDPRVQDYQCSVLLDRCMSRQGHGVNASCR